MKPPVSHALFRERVTRLLARSGLSYAAFARKAGLDRSTLSQLLSGPMPRLPRAETLSSIASTAHVSVDWLLGLSQREEIGSEIIEAVMQIEPYGQTPAQGSFLDWLQAAEGQRIVTVPIGVPDLLKTETVLRHDYAAGFSGTGPTPLDAVNQRLAVLQMPHQQLELATSRDSLLALAHGIGHWEALSREDRRAQFDHMIALVDSLYPTLRLYLYDAGRAYSVPFTVFGTHRVAVFLGTSYLVLNSASHLQLFLGRFDDLIRAATVLPHQVADHLRQMRDRIE